MILFTKFDKLCKIEPEMFFRKVTNGGTDICRADKNTSEAEEDDDKGSGGSDRGADREKNVPAESDAAAGPG